MLRRIHTKLVNFELVVRYGPLKFRGFNIHKFLLEIVFIKRRLSNGPTYY